MQKRQELAAYRYTECQMPYSSGPLHTFPAPCSMFRVADMQKSQVVAPSVQAFLYVWGDGLTTAEGQHIPVHVQELQIDVW